MPFFFYPVKVTKVLLGLSYFKKHTKLRYGALLGAYSGLGAGLSGLLALRRRIAPCLSGINTQWRKFSTIGRTGFSRIAFLTMA